MLVGGALTGLGMLLGMSSVEAALFASAASKTLIQLLGTVALSALSTALQDNPSSAGIVIAETQTGGTNPCSFILGYYATAGQRGCPRMSHGEAGNVPNAYLTDIIELSDIKGVTLEGMILDGEEVEFGPTDHPDYGRPLLGKFEGFAWVKFYDGSQTSADPMLLDKYSDYPKRPWSADMVYTGVAYAIVTTRYNTNVFPGSPRCLFVMMGIPVYDPRKDTTVGGSGPHRWGFPATYEQSGNNYVLTYNVKRGIEIEDLEWWGGECEAEDLPLSVWFTAMNDADVDHPLSGGGTQKRWRAGIEVRTTDEPMGVVDKLLVGANGEIADIGGVWKVRSGGPGLPLFAFTDTDLLVDEPQVMDPFLALDQTYNAITATYPEPAALWEEKEAPPRFDAALEARDGGRRLPASLALPAVNVKQQVQRLMKAKLADHQRNIQHQVPFSRRFGLLEPLDTGSWTSARNGYSAKLFEVAEVSEDPMQSGPGVALRECDPADYGWVVGDELPVDAPEVGIVPPLDLTPVQLVDFDVDPIGVSDGVGLRRQGIRVSWNPEGLEGAEGIALEVRLTSAVFEAGYLAPNGDSPTLVFDPALDVYATDINGWAGLPRPSLIFDPAFDRFGVNEDWSEPEPATIVIKVIVPANRISLGVHYITDNVLARVHYSVRGEVIADYPTMPTGWFSVYTGSVGVALADFLGSGAVIDRGSLIDNSTMDTNWIGQILPATVTATVDVQQLILSPQSIAILKIFWFSLKFEARKTGASNWDAMLQERQMYGGVWGAWSTVQTWTISGGSYALFSTSGSRAGGAEDYQYRMATTSAAANVDAFKAAYLTISERV